MLRHYKRLTEKCDKCYISRILREIADWNFSDTPGQVSPFLAFPSSFLDERLSTVPAISTRVRHSIDLLSAWKTGEKTTTSSPPVLAWIEILRGREVARNRRDFEVRRMERVLNIAEAGRRNVDSSPSIYPASLLRPRMLTALTPETELVSRSRRRYRPLLREFRKWTSKQSSPRRTTRRTKNGAEARRSRIRSRGSSLDRLRVRDLIYNRCNIKVSTRLEKLLGEAVGIVERINSRNRIFITWHNQRCDVRKISRTPSRQFSKRTIYHARMNVSVTGRNSRTVGTIEATYIFAATVRFKCCLFARINSIKVRGGLVRYRM